MNRREALIAGFATPLLAGCSTLTQDNNFGDSIPSFVSAPDFTSNPGIDRSRASFILNQAGLDAVLMHLPDNIYYSTGYWAALPRVGLDDTTFAVIPKDPSAPIILLCSQFTYYYSISDINLAEGVEPYLVTWPKDNQAADAYFFSQDEEQQLTNKELLRRKKTNNSKPFHATSGAGLEAVFAKLGIRSSKLGYDSLEAMQLLETAAPDATHRYATDIVKHMRLIKSPREIALMKHASSNNVAAALQTAKLTRTLGSSVKVRNHFMAEAAKRGNRYEFMVVNSSINLQYDEELKEGTTVLIDCVSSYLGYYGDYGRTIFIGEPQKEIGEKVQAMGVAWNELKNNLRPGMTFSEIQEKGANIIKKMSVSVNVPFGPHSVGLAHTEQPKLALDGSRIDHVLEPGMIISVDCPLTEANSMGTAHLEDLTLITANGSEPIHDPGNQIILA